MELVLFLTAAVLMCVLFLTGMVLSGGVPVSLSAVYYLLDKRGWVFQLAMIGAGAMLMPLWLDLSDEGYQWLVFLACGGMIFVGAAPSFRLPLQGIIHYSSAVLCCVCAVAWQILEGLWDVTLFFGFFGGMLALMWREKWCWWMEIAVMCSLMFNVWRLW